MAMFDSLEDKPKQSITPQSRLAMGLLVSGLFLTVIALDWHPAILFSGKDWSELFHLVVGGIGIVLELTGMILLVRAIARTRAGKS